MKNFLSIILIIIILLRCSDQLNYEDPEAVIKRIPDNYIEGNYKKVFQDVIWIHDNASKLKSSLKERAVNVKLIYWSRLPRVYSEALPKLIEIRNLNVVAIKDGKMSRHLFKEVVYLDKGINETARPAPTARRCRRYGGSPLLH